MAYDATLLTGSDEKAVEPISIDFHNNDEEIGSLNSGHLIIQSDDVMLSNAMEAFDHATELKVELARSVRRGDRLDNTSYSILNTSLKNIIRKSKVKLDPLPAMESIDNSTKRELTLVMENIVTDTIKSIWEKIKNLFISAHNKIKEWFIRAFAGAGKLVHQAESLKAKAENMSAAAIKNNTFDMSGVKFLNVNGKAANPQQIAAGVELITQIGEALLGKNAESYNNMFSQLEKTFKDTIDQAKNMKDSNNKPDDPDNKKSASISESFNGKLTGNGGPTSVNNSAGTSVVTNQQNNKTLSGLLGAFIEMAKAAGIDWSNESNKVNDDTRFGTDIYASRNPKDLLGGIMLVAVFPVKGVDTIESYGSFKSGFKISPEPIVNPPKEIEDKGTFTTASTQVVINICDNVITAGKTMMNYKLLFEARDVNTGKLVKEMEQAVSQYASLKGAGEKHIQSTIQTTIAIIKKQQDGETRWAKYAFSVLNKAIVYSRNSLAQY